MKLKAQSVIEIALLICLLAIVGFSIFVIYNKQNISLADKSKSGIFASQPVDLNALAPNSANDIIPYSGDANISDAALDYLAMSLGLFNWLMSNITYQTLQDILTSNPAFFELANTILALSDLNYPDLNAGNINAQTISTLIAIFNYTFSSNSSETNLAYQTQFNALINAIHAQVAETTGSVMSIPGGGSGTCTPGGDYCHIENPGKM